MTKGWTLQVRGKQWLFVVPSRLGFAVRTTRVYWALITKVKHPAIAGKEGAVQRALKHPDQVRLSKFDPSVYLFYRRAGKRHLCVVAKRIDRYRGFIMTAYVTDRIKEGTTVWKK